MYISDESIQYVIDMMGGAYGLWGDTFDSDITKRNSYEFLRSRIDGFLSNAYAIYSVAGSSYCTVTALDDVTVTVAEGYVVNQSNDLVKVSEHDVAVNHYFSYPYDSDSQYGVLIGIYHDDIESASTIKTSTLAASVTASTSTTITVRSSDAFSGITFPAIMTIDGEDILISSFNSITKVATIDSSYHSSTGTVASSHTAGTTVYTHKNLSASAIFGVPVPSEYQSGETAANFSFYPPTPTDFMLLAKVLVEKPATSDNPTNDTAIVGSIYDVREIGDQSVDEPFTTEEKFLFADLSSKLDNMSSTLTLNDTFRSICSILKTSTIQNSDKTRTGLFQDYYNDSPIKRASYFKYGVQWDNVERFEFPEGFRQLWYDLFGEELLVTLAIFSGNMMDSIHTSGVSAPDDLSGTATQVGSPSTGTISPGTWVYYVTAVTSSGESPLSESASIVIPSWQSYNTITLTWDAVSGADYYHIYRRSSDSSLANDIRLTSASEVTSATYTDTGVAGQTSTARGCILTEKTSIKTEGTALYAKVPVIEDTGSYFAFSQLEESVTSTDGGTTGMTNNGVRLSLTLEKVNGSTVSTTLDIPAGTQAGTSFQITEDADYSGITDMNVCVIEGDAEVVGSRVDWSLQDIIMIQNIP